MRRSFRVLLVGRGSHGGPGGGLPLARALRDQGWEVVHLGEVADAAVVAAVARDEDADAVVTVTGADDEPEVAVHARSGAVGGGHRLSPLEVGTGGVASVVAALAGLASAESDDQDG